MFKPFIRDRTYFVQLYLDDKLNPRSSTLRLLNLSNASPGGVLKPGISVIGQNVRKRKLLNLA